MTALIAALIAMYLRESTVYMYNVDVHFLQENQLGY